MLKKHNKLVMLLVLVTFMFTMVGSAGAAAFSDVSGNTAQSAAIYKLTSLGIVDGYPDGTFGPDKTLTRAEFAKIAVNTAGLDAVAAGMAGTASAFSDVTADFWANGFINVASAQGYVKGYPDGTFQPQATVTQAEVITVLLRLLGYNDNLPGVWPANYIAKAANLGILDDVTFNASAPATRGIMAILTAAALDENVVKYLASDNVFEEDLIDDEPYTLLADRFDDAAVTEDVLVTAVGWNGDDYTLTTFDFDAYDDDNDLDDTVETVILKDAVVVGAASMFALEGSTVDFIMNDDEEITYVAVQSTKAPVFGKVDEIGDDYITIDDEDYNLNDDFFVTISKLWDSGLIDVDGLGNALTDSTEPVYVPAYGTSVPEYAVLKTYADQILDSKVSLFFDDDNKIIFISKSAADSTMVVDDIDVEDGEISTKTDYTVEDLTEDDDCIILKNNVPITLADVQEGDVFYDVYNSWDGYAARGFDRYVAIVNIPIKGDFTRWYSSSEEGVIGGTTYDFANLNALTDQKGIYLEDSNGDEVAYDDIADLTGGEVIAKIDANREIAYVSGATTDSSNPKGVIIDLGLYQGRGEDAVWVKMFNVADGTTVTYDLDEDYVDDENISACGSDYSYYYSERHLHIDEVDGYLYTEYLVEYSLNADGYIDYIDYAEYADEDLVNNTYDATIGDAETDYDRLYVDGWKYGGEDTVVVDMGYDYDDYSIDPELSTWADLMDADYAYAYVYSDGSDLKYVLVMGDGVTTSEEDGVYVSSYTEDGDDYITLYVAGALKDYQISSDPGLDPGAIITFTLDGDEISDWDYAEPYYFGTVSDVNTSNFVTEDGTFLVESDTMFVLMDGDDVDTVGDFGDLDDGDEVLILDGGYEGDDDEGVAQIVIILDGTDPYMPSTPM